MKKNYTITTILVAFLFIGTGSNTASAQSLLAGAVYGTDSDLGLKLGGYFPVAELILVGGDFIYFFPDGFDMYEVNINGLYLLPVEAVQLHGIVGLNYTSFSFDGSDLCDGLGGFGISSDICSASSSDIGLNIGGMASFGSGPLGFFVDAKFVIGGGEQLEVGGGIKYLLGDS